MLCKRLALPAHDAGIKEVPTKQQLNEIEENIKYMENQLVGQCIFSLRYIFLVFQFEVTTKTMHVWSGLKITDQDNRR